MRKGISFLFPTCLLALLSFSTCSTTEEDTKLVAIGDSITMGIQDAGLVKNYQLNNFPYLIAKQMGLGDTFEQPYVSPPGFGNPPFAEPLRFENGRIIATYIEGETNMFALLLKIFPLLENISLERPYDNLGVGGAWLHDIRRTTSYENSVAPDNYLFDLVLRNFNSEFGNTTVLQQAIELEPTIILLWIGNNDILRAVMEGGDTSQITDSADFRNEFTALLSELQAYTEASIFMANIPGYLAFMHILDDIFQTVNGFQSNVPVPILFNTETIQPIDFGDAGSPLYIPLLTLEGTDVDPVEFLVQDAIEGYLQEGLGIPNANDILDMGLAADESEAEDLFLEIQAAMNASGVTMGTGVGIPFSEDLTITESEFTDIFEAITEFNVILEDLSSQFNIPLVDINHLWNPENEGAFGGYSGAFVLDDPENTIFSLDGVHPNNLGHAIIANAFINKINEELQMGIQKVNPEDFKGQYAPYTGAGIKKSTIQALTGVRDFYIQ